MYSLSKTMVYFLIFTVIGSFIAYRLVVASYEEYDYDYASTDTLKYLDENEKYR